MTGRTNWQGMLFREWFVAQERSLREQAKLAGLLQHSSTVGTAREFLVKNFLAAVLPPIIHVGSGVIIDAHDRRSKQIDVILYDSRFPLMEFERGVGLYPSEGVVATIEVKSKLTAKELRLALENCYSVHTLGLASPNPDAIPKRAADLREELKTTEIEARIHAGCEIAAPTYIFGYSGLGASKLCDTIDDWFKQTKRRVLAIGKSEDGGPAGLCPTLPRVVISGKSIGLANDGWIRFVPSGEDKQAIRDACGPSGRAMMGFWKTNWPFWWFAAHILHSVCNRIGMSHAASGLRYKVDHYFSQPEALDKPKYLSASPFSDRAPSAGDPE